MAYPNPFRKHDAQTRNCWGYTFQLTEEHLTPEKTEPLKFSYDTLGSRALEKLNEISPPGLKSREAENKTADPKVEADSKVNNAPPKRDLYTLLRDNADKNDILGELWKQVNTVPEWVDWDQIGRGQDVFYRYGGGNITGLTFQSLVGGMGSARVVETLARTGGFSTQVARRRLYETMQHILQVTRSIDSIKPGGEGFASSIRVRLLHAAVRNRIVKLATDHPTYYDIKKNGIPINDLDSIGTIGTFSATLIWIALPRQGLFLRQQEIADYLALWRYIAYLVGTPTDHFSTPTKARRIMESLLLYEIDPTPTGQVLAGNVIASLMNQAPQYPSRGFLEATARWLNGNELCDRLGLGKPSFYYKVLVAGQCLFFMIMCYPHRYIPYLDKRKVQTLRRIFWMVVVEGKDGLKGTSSFEFQYVPEHLKTTEAEDGQSGILKPRGTELRSLKTLLAMILMLCLCYYIISWVLRSIIVV